MAGISVSIVMFELGTIWPMRYVFIRLASVPKLFRGDAGALSHGLELRPHHARVNTPIQFFLRKTAVGSGNDVFPADAFGETADPFSDQLGMFDDICSVA